MLTFMLKGGSKPGKMPWLSTGRGYVLPQVYETPQGIYMTISMRPIAEGLAKIDAATWVEVPASSFVGDRG